MREKLHRVATVDARVARLFACRETPGGTLRLEPIESIRNNHEGEHERHRPSMLDGGAKTSPGSPGGTPPHFATPSDAAQEEQRRFAREVAAWIQRVDAERTLTVFAAPRFLGLLRKELGNSPRLQEGEFSRMSAAELAEHPAIRALFP